MKTRREFLNETSRGVCALGLTGLGTSEEEKTGKTGFVYDDIYLKHNIRPDHPESPERLRRILAEMRSLGLDQEVMKLPLLENPMPGIQSHHTAAHVSAIKRIPTTGEVAEAAVGGALAAVEAVAKGKVKNAFCALRPPGHHANNTGKEEGFCYYSNAAIAAKHAQSFGFEKVLIIDWDYHHGNATQNAFYEDPTVLFFSTHDWNAYPRTGDPALTGAGEAVGLNINVHLDCGARDKDMLDAWDRKLLPVAEKFEPDFIVISAGFDSRKDDLLGCFLVTDDAFARMTRTAMDVARRQCRGRIVSLLEGGYNIDGLAKGVAAHLSALLAG